MSYAPDADPIKFSGIKSIVQSKEGHLILSWDPPEAGSRPVETYEIYVSEITSADQIPNPEAAALFLQDNKAAGAVGIVVDMASDSSPAQVGTVVGAVTNATSYTIEGLSAANYGFQVKAIDGSGQKDENTKVLLYTLDEAVRFQGIESAEISGDKILIKWSPFISSVKGEEQYYIVYEGITFADSERVGIVQADKTFFEIPTSEKTPGSAWTYGVRVKDPRGIIDSNINLKTVQVPEDNSDYFGCLAGKAKGATLITIEVEFPKTADKVNVYRNGKIVFSTTSPENVIFDDRDGLNEGVKYTYKCEFERRDFKKVGSNVLEISTLNSNPPTFSGIQNVTADGSSKAKLSWGVATGVPAAYFNVYVTPGQNIDWGAKPVAEVESTKLETIIENLGDELPYSFGIRACTEADICDTNTVSILLTLPDGGPPKSVGATEAKVIDGKMHITAPWKHSDGAVLKREIFVYLGTNDIKNFSKYTRMKTVVVNNLIAPETNLVLDALTEKAQYNIIVRDVGPSGASNQNLNVVSKNSGDLSPPLFPGLSKLTLGDPGQQETTLKVGFTAIAPEVLEASGASHYQVYTKKEGGDACKNGSLHIEFAAAAFAQNVYFDYIISGLDPGTVYSVCLKARDLSGNISLTDSFLSRSTLDTTPPVFDGIQAIEYILADGTIRASWNQSPSDDAHEYRVKIWANSDTPAENEILTITKKHDNFKTGFVFDDSVFLYGSGDTVYVLVDACDNAGKIPGGKQNCTSYALNTARKITLADIEPPPGFAGIAGQEALLTPSEGVIQVTWVAQEDKSDYAGFKVYTVDSENKLTQIQQCACTKTCPMDSPCTVSCPEYCEVTGLDPYRTYDLHVRAYDEVGNITQIDPSGPGKVQKRASDTTPPTFVPALSLVFEDGFSKLNWSAASDNQYINEPGAIVKYQIWRKAGTAFANAGTPEIDGEIIETTEELFFNDNDNGNFVSGELYFYNVCAIDASLNRTCENSFKYIETPDLVPPTIVSFTTTKTPADKTWNLNWVVTDNSSPDIIIKLHRSISIGGPGTATELDPIVVTSFNSTGYNGLSGPKNQDVYINYLLVAEDTPAKNRSYATLSVLSKNKVEITSVASNEGVTSGGRFLVVNGSGFHSSTQFKLGKGVNFQDCTNVNIITEKIAVCNTPSYTAGAVDITATNIDGSTFTLANAYTYCESGSCTNICNNPTAWNQALSPRFATGNGTSSDPFVICNGAQLNEVRISSNNGKHIHLGDNINLNTFPDDTFAPLFTEPSDNSWRAFFDGNGYIVANWVYNAPPGTNSVGLFRYLYSGYDIKNIGLINSTVSGQDQVGGILGYCWSSVSLVENAFFTGSVTGRDYIGGVVGRGNCQQLNMFASGTIEGRRGVGGVIGFKEGQVGYAMQFSGTVTSTGVSGECYAGGLVGYWNGNGQELSEVSSDATVICDSTTNRYTGGLFGRTLGLTIIGPTFTGSVTGAERVGGIVGDMNSSTNVFDAIVEPKLIDGLGPYVGGVAGVSGGHIKGAIFTGDITTATKEQVGGIAGHINSSAGGIENSVVNGNIASTAHEVGGLAGRVHQGTIRGSRSIGKVSGTSYIGGLVGRNYHYTLVVESSYSTADVTGTGDYVGGLVGENHWYGIMTNSYALGKVKGNNYVGGVFGRCRVSASGVIQKSYAKGDVLGNGAVGGFCGQIENGYSGGPDVDITESYATGNVTGLGNTVGGFVGRIDSNVKITRSYATGKVVGSSNVGGFFGYSYIDNVYILESYATGDVTGDDFVGGFGGHYYYARNSMIADSYATGKTTGTNSVGGFLGHSGDMVQRVYASGAVEKKIPAATKLGGLVGNFNKAYTASGGLGSVMDSFWDTEATKQATSGGGGTGRTSAEMKTQASYENWDFTTIWQISEGQSTPTLRMGE